MDVFMNYSVMRMCTLIGFVIALAIFIAHLCIYWVDKKKDSNDFFTYSFFVLAIMMGIEVLNVYHIFYTGSIAKVVMLVFLVSTLIASVKLRTEMNDRYLKRRRKEKK